MEDAHVRAPRDVLAHFGVSDAAKGLTQTQFQDQLVIILLLAAIVSFGLAVLDLWEASDAAALSSSDLVPAFVEPLEANAEKAIEALKEYSPDEAKAVRDGHVVKLPARDLVPGDIIDLAAGDKIPADARVLSISSSSFRVDQAILTGESVSVFKDIAAIKDTQAVKQDMINMLFSGTTITIGKARAVVVATGEATAIGHIHKAISETESDKSPLKKKLDEFGDWLAKMITVICVLVWVINIRHFNDPNAIAIGSPANSYKIYCESSRDAHTHDEF
ncbi:HAD ATPase, P-type, family IC [Allomyces macrogynus ATCC 38327]|uniref:P-type Ca(2+) transporter n=1 Tax=Allomyces macrogynus (strain ATCC 38327) TaxID=578462 RepID=A0A0L0TEJ1_ALLM3|nr:HAD ATPase, P-type, family IC [Allomyces macrogynus ATCC 38327]|eukprot:KNE72974.1 HAD ATPase, P-type, family IC [Allomyces macrogynus ATCC 38327]